MTKIDIYSGFLGAGKTTLIKKMIKEAYAGENLVLIENGQEMFNIDCGLKIHGQGSRQLKKKSFQYGMKLTKKKWHIYLDCAKNLILRIVFSFPAKIVEGKEVLRIFYRK